MEQRSPKLSTTPNVQKSTQTVKGGAELQQQLNVAQDELKKARDRLTTLENEKIQTLKKLNEAKIKTDETTKKIAEVIMALSKAEEEIEIERFRLTEIEQAGIEAAKQREDVWEKELEAVWNQHALDVSALLTTTQELQRVQQELVITIKAKKTTLTHADDAMKIAEINAEKVESLSAELTCLKSMVDAKLKTKMNEDAEQVKSLEIKLNALRCELEKALEAQNNLADMETLTEELRIEVNDAKKAESMVNNLVDEWKNEVVLLEVKVAEAIQSKQSSSNALAIIIRQLDECNASLQDAISEIACLKEKVESSELKLSRLKVHLDESERHLETYKLEELEMEIMVEVLKYEIQSNEQEKVQALENEKAAAANLQKLLEEKIKVVVELENSREEVEYIKKAMDDLTLALHDVSTEAREQKERLLTQQVEVTDAKGQIDRLSQVIKSTEEKYMAMLNDTKEEIIRLEADVERYDMEVENSRINWNRKEQSFMNSLTKSEEEVNQIKAQLDAVVGKLKEAELEAVTTKDEGFQLLAKIKEAEVEAATASEVAEELKATGLQMKEALLDKENELQSIIQENNDLRSREGAALEKIKELSRLLNEATTKKVVPNDKLTSDVEEFLSQPKPLDLLDDVGSKSEKQKGKSDTRQEYEHIRREDGHEKETKGSNEEGEAKEPLVDVKILENSEVMDKASSPETEHESKHLDNDTESKPDSESAQQVDGLLSLDGTKNGWSNEKQHKKKKVMLRKFGGLLKKKST